ncbi:MAG: DUF1064 domain-containing protein [Alphaproteobacteria bacterium]
MRNSRYKKNKYKNKKVCFGGDTFDSKRELNRYLVLKDAEQRGVITDLQRQVTFELIPPITQDYIKHLKTKDKVVTKVIQRAINYTSDFTYYKNGEYVVEDCKISPKLKPKEYALKYKMMFALKGIRIKEVYNATDEI